MFDWINDIASWIGQLVPKWGLLEPTDEGIKFKPGGKIVAMKSGHIYWYWPAVTVVTTMNVKRQTMSFNQRLTTADDYTISINTVVVYEIEDIRKALVDTYDFEDTIEEVAQKLTVQPIMSRTFDEIKATMADSNDMRNELTRGARTLLGPYGVRVLDTYVSDFTETRVLSHEGDGLSVNYNEDEDE
jgi:regulator of protease activity HflC (stomatin/prohibitin superfamily)